VEGEITHILTPEDSPKYTAKYLENDNLELTIAKDVKGYNLIKVNVIQSENPRNIIFKQMRDGKTIGSIGITEIFDPDNDDVTAGFNLKGGDIILITAE
jgi:hypothetical protein